MYNFRNKRWRLAIDKWRYNLLAFAVLCIVIILIRYNRTRTLLPINLNKIVDKEDVRENVSCAHGVPCVYPEKVHFRIIVLTYNRAESLQKLLTSLDAVELDGDKGRLEIWIDRSTAGTVHNATVAVAQQFNWRQGKTRVHLQTKHAGIFGQWINTWSPSFTSSGAAAELALILEDDINVSPYVYRWIKAVHLHYGTRNDFGGCSLQSDEVLSHVGSRPPLSAPKNHTTFMYKVIGTWGFSPSPGYWREFQQWFHRIRLDKSFRPLIPLEGLLINDWYKYFEREESMWEQFFSYFTHDKKLFTVYNNLKVHNNDTRSCLSINRREIGLHYSVKGREDLCELLTRWDSTFIAFPNVTQRLDYDGKVILV